MSRSPWRRRVAGALLAGLIVSGCRGGGGDSQPVTIRFWGFGREGEVVQMLVPEFERRHPGIHVIVEQIPWTAAHEKLLTSIVGDATPDVAQLGNTWIPELVTLNALAPLDTLVAHSSEVSATAFFPGIWATNLIGDTVYGIPWYVDTRVIFYRTDLLAQAGYRSPPRTWAAWRAAMEQLKSRMGPRRWPLLMPTNEWNQPVILALEAGSPILRDGGRYGAFEQPAFRRAFGFYVSLFRDSLAPAVSNTEIANLYQQFAAGDFAMYITGPWNIGEFQSRLPDSMDGRWLTAPMPAPDSAAADSGYPGASTAGGSSLVLFRRSAHPAAVWSFIEYLTQPAQQLRFYQLTGDLPARTSAWDDSTLSTNRYARAFRIQLEHVLPTPKVPEWEQIATKIQEYGEAAARRAMTVDQALAGLQRDVDAILAKRRWVLARAATARGGR